MIRVTIELIPHGDESLPRSNLGVIEIGNDGTGNSNTGNYNTRFTQVGGKKAWRKGRVRGFKRLQRNAYDLLYLALQEQVGYRNSTGT